MLDSLLFINSFEATLRSSLVLVFSKTVRDGIPPFCCIKCTIQLSIISKIAEDVLNPVYVAHKDGESELLKDNTHHQHPQGHKNFDNNPLAAPIQQIPSQLSYYMGGEIERSHKEL